MALKEAQMTKLGVLVTLACAILSTATSARAQENSEHARQAVAEVTPFASLGSGTGVGAAVRWPLGSSPVSVEVETNYRLVEIGALSFNLSLLYDLPKLGPAVPYLAGGVESISTGPVNSWRESWSRAIEPPCLSMRAAVSG